MRPNNGLSGSALPPPSTPPEAAAQRLAEKLKMMERWQAKKDDRHGPLRSRWYKEQEMWGAQKNVKKHYAWCGNGPYRCAKGGGRICFATGKAQADLSSAEVKHQLGTSYHVPINVPKEFQGRRPDYVLLSNETLRGPPSPPASPRRAESVMHTHPTLSWKHEWWGQPRSISSFGVSPSGEGMAAAKDIVSSGLRGHATPVRASWTASRPLASPDRENKRLQLWETRRSMGSTRRLPPVVSQMPF